MGAVEGMAGAEEQMVGGVVVVQHRRVQQPLSGDHLQQVAARTHQVVAQERQRAHVLLDVAPSAAI